MPNLFRDRSSATIPRRVAAALGMSCAVAVVVWGITNARFPYFTVPEEYGFGMSPPPEVVAAYLEQKDRVDKLNSMITFAIGGGLLGVVLSALAVGGWPLLVRLPVGLLWGALWGAGVGHLAVIVFAALMPKTAIASVTDAGMAQAVIFALLGIGLGILYGGSSKSIQTTGVAILAGAIAGAAGAMAFPIVSGFIAPTQSTQEMIPAGRTVRLLWLLLPFATIGFLIPFLPGRTPARESLPE